MNKKKNINEEDVHQIVDYQSQSRVIVGPTHRWSHHSYYRLHPQKILYLQNNNFILVQIFYQPNLGATN